MNNVVDTVPLDVRIWYTFKLSECNEKAGIKLFMQESKCKFTSKEVAAKLSLILVLTYTHFFTMYVQIGLISDIHFMDRFAFLYNLHLTIA